MQKPQRPTQSQRRNTVVVGGAASEGRPALGGSETLRAESDGTTAEVTRDQTTVLTRCPACGAVFHKAEEVAARCVCGGLVCQTCSLSRCSEPRCVQPVCPPCRERISSDAESVRYLCLPHHAEWLRERMLIGLTVLATVAALSVIVFLFLR